MYIIFVVKYFEIIFLKLKIITLLSLENRKFNSDITI